MKKLLLSILFIAGLISAEAQNLVSITPLDTITKGSLNFLANGLAKYDVGNYKILYQTPDVDGNVSIASGLMSVPLVACDSIALTLYCHGTVLERDDVPSRNNVESVIGKIGASRGYVVAMPDYLGLGDSPGIHPYMHAETQATASIDMMRAVRQALADSIGGYPLNSEVFVTGYSQGGHAAMAVAKYIQDENLSTEFNVVAAAPASGPYNLAGSQSTVFLYDQPYSNPGYVVYLLLGMNEAYGGSLFSNPSEILKAPYDVSIPPYFNGNYPMDSVNSKLPANVSGYIEDSILQAFVADSVNQQYWLWNILNENSNYDWTPNMPIRMFYCTADEQVNFQNALDAEAAMTLNGALDVRALNKGPFNHGGCVGPSVQSAVLFFDSLTTSCTAFVGLNDFVTNSYEAYPNPFSDELILEGLSGTVALKILDLNGRLVHQTTTEQGRLVLRLAHLPKGMYLLELEAEGRQSRRRILKQ
ncbi:MAG: T9SS type A sorting domain-containing protein [Bacteroidetes bacterium]|nr:T9SS type A sorting domain-containing protein [Bacteroidota bacterium]